MSSTYSSFQTTISRNYVNTTPDVKLAESAKRFANQTGEPPAHTLGNSLFKIYQHTKGEEMLSGVVHGKFVFPA